MKPTPFIDPQVCQMCQECLARARCKPRAIVRFELDSPPFVDPSRCRACYICALDCPFGAIGFDMEARSQR